MSRTHRHLRRIGVGVLAATAALTLVACSSSSADTGSPGSDAVTALSGTASSGGAPKDLGTIDVVNTAAKNLEAADDLGFFKKYGLKVNVRHLLNGPAVLAALQGGSGVIGYADFYAGLNANAQGFKLDLVAGRNGNEGDKVLLVKADSEINKPADLVGKSVTISPIPQARVNINGFLKANGVDPGTVDIQTVQGSSLLPAALRNGTAAAISGSWSNLYDGQDAFKTIGNPDSSAWSKAGATSAGFWATEDYASNHQDVVNAFANAVHDYNRWLKTLSPQTYAALNDKYEETHWVDLAGGDEDRLNKITDRTNLQSGPFQFDASQDWYELGQEYAPDDVKPGVDLHEVVNSSAQQPEPTGDYPAEAIAFAEANGS